MEGIVLVCCLVPFMAMHCSWSRRVGGGQFARLPDEATALVLQQLSNTDRLAAAATCEFMRGVALQQEVSSKISWKHAQEVRVTAAQLAQLANRSSNSSSWCRRSRTKAPAHPLLKLVPVHLTLDNTHLPAPTIRSVSRFSRIDTEQGSSAAALAPVLLHAAGVAHVQQLVLRHADSGLSAESLARLPRVTSLTLRHARFDGAAPLRQCVTTLLQNELPLQKLCLLNCNGVDLDIADAIVQGNAPRLRHLSMHHGLLDLQQRFAGFCASPSLALLEELELSGVIIIDAGSAARLQRGLRRLHSLHTLRLLFPYPFAATLAMLSAAVLPALTELHVHQHVFIAGDSAAVQTLHGALPLLHIHLTAADVDAELALCGNVADVVHVAAREGDWS